MQNLTAFPRAFRSVEIKDGKPLLIEKAFPELSGPNAIVVSPRLIGICRSDLKELTGVRTMRNDFGHEIVGDTEWASDSLGFVRGDRICFNPHPNIARTSGFGEFLVAQGEVGPLREAFIGVPHSISPESLVFCEPMACAQHCVSKLLENLGRESLRECRVGILGAGIAGSLIGLLAKNLDGSVTLLNRNTQRLDFLRKRGIFPIEELRSFSSALEAVFDIIIATTSFLYPSVMGFPIELLINREILLEQLPGTLLSLTESDTAYYGKIVVRPKPKFLNQR